MADESGKSLADVIDAVNATVAAADVLVGRQAVTATTAKTALVTVPAGRTFKGTLAASVTCANAAATAGTAQATVVFDVTGTGAVPTAGPVFTVDAIAGGNAATGTVGSNGTNFGSVTDFLAIAPAGNSITVDTTVTIVGTAGRASSSVIGRLL